MTAIETTRLLLRPPELGDAAALSAQITPMISGFTATWPYPYDQARAQARLVEIIKANGDSTGFFRAITLKGEAGLIGWLAMGLGAGAIRTGTLSYWLGEAFHRQGYISEALPPFVQGATAALGLGRILAGARPDNTASIKALERLGMAKTGEGMHFVPARNREELCVFYELSPASKVARPSR